MGLEAEEGLVDGLGVRLFELFGEDGSEHDIGGDAGHFSVDFEGGGVGCVLIEALEHGVDGGGHFGEHRLEACLGKGLVDEAALAFPDRTIGGEDACSEEGFEDFMHQLVLGVAGCVFDEDATDPEGFVHHVEIEATLVDVAHFHAVAFFEQDVEPGVPAAEEAQEERALVLVWFWIGGGERHVH